ncbi:MAG: HupE/UreJ family protein [Gemmatimonadota bacterium]|nr:HupE/UreJ family protein [Gemmatimonadota bacterium]MDE2873675.1 HupE/UreJ family protein [Gemmatimonadota bacterium]
MKGRTRRSGAIAALAAAMWMPVAPAGGVGAPETATRSSHPVPAPGPPARPPAPHEIPADVIVRAFVRAEAVALNLVVRVPLTSMRDVDFPVRGPGYVDIEGATALLADQATVWIAGYVTLYEESVLLPAPIVTGARISLPSDPSFADYDRAVAHIAAPPLPPATDLMLEQAVLDVMMRVPVESARSRFSIDPAWAHLGLRTTTVLRFITPDGADRVFQYRGNPGLVRLDPRWHQALLNFVALGFAHILDGIDHLLFLLCLVIPLRRIWPLVSVVTAFTVAHSITLVASVLGLAPEALWFPPLIEMLIAASIVFMALENIVGKALGRRWAWAFGFGLVHGFGFSFQLGESLQFAGSHLFTSLLGFNVGVELGQLVVLVFMVPGLALLFSKVMKPRIGAIVVSALVAHTSLHWMAERWGVLRAYEFVRPVMDAGFGAVVLRWVLLALIVVGVGWGLGVLYRQLAARFGVSKGDRGKRRRRPVGAWT